MAVSRRLIGSSIAVLIVLVLAGGIYLRITGSDTSDASAFTGSDENEPAVSTEARFATDLPIPVEGAMVVRDTLVVSVAAAAQAAAQRRATQTAQVQGRVTAVRARENQRVATGSALLEIDPTEYQLGVSRAEAVRTRAEAEFRELTLFDDQIADSTVRAERSRVARAKSGLEEAEVALREARLRLEQTRVTAPFPGRVANVRVVEGQWVSVGDELLSVVDLDPIKVEVQVLESEVGMLDEGRGAAVSFAAFPGETFHGRIATINPVVETDTRTARVTVSIPNPNARILPGMYARVSLEAQQFPDRILVPRSAILERDQRRSLVFVFEGENATGLSKWRYVTTGLSNDSLIEIVEHPETDMVQPGEVVLTDGHYTLIHDAHVRLVEDVRAAGGRR